MAKKKVYAVVKGRNPGIYKEWFGGKGAEIQVKGFPGAVYKGFETLPEAERWLQSGGDQRSRNTCKQAESVESPAEVAGQKDAEQSDKLPSSLPQVLIYTDGACTHNPGPGGYGVVLLNGDHRKELSGGFRFTTNNRMEIMAAIVALKSLTTRCDVTIYSDSKYLVDAITRGWAKRWRANSWKRSKTETAVNPDLWEQLLQLCETHRVRFLWVKGHAGNSENERCDQLATQAAQQRNLLPDEPYEAA
jgi:ribonuclease HI